MKRNAAVGSVWAMPFAAPLIHAARWPGGRRSAVLAARAAFTVLACPASDDRAAGSRRSTLATAHAKAPSRSVCDHLESVVDIRERTRGFVTDARRSATRAKSRSLPPIGETSGSR